MTTSCPYCAYYNVPEGSLFCPGCGKALAKTPESVKKVDIQVDQKVGSIAERGKATGVEIGQLEGGATIESTVNQIEAKIIQGHYVDRQTITQNILVLGPEALDQIVKKLAGLQGVDKQSIQVSSQQPLPDNISRQIVEVAAAQRETAAQGMSTTPEAAYRLGMLAASNREYVSALEYFRQVVRADPEFTDAFESLAWLQQSRAIEFLDHGQYNEAYTCLAEAREAAVHTDPLNASALAQRGFIAKTLAELADAQGRAAERDKYYAEAERLFAQAARLEPNDPSAYNGLGNVRYARGKLAKAITAYKQAIKLSPAYTSAYHDLALAYEARLVADPGNAAKWRKAALQAWRKAYQLAPDDPGFTAEDILTIGKRIRWLESMK